VSIDTSGSGFDTLLAVYTGTAVRALTPIAASGNPGGGGTSGKVAFKAQAGTEYQIAVDGLGGASGDVALRWGDPTVSTLIPTLPGWGAALLAVGLVAVAARLHKVRRLRD
jgi:hypothetical protein